MYDAGLTKLIDAAAAVDRMQIELSEKKVRATLSSNPPKRKFVLVASTGG